VGEVRGGWGGGGSTAVPEPAIGMTHHCAHQPVVCLFAVVNIVLSPLLFVGVVPHHPVDPKQAPIEVSHSTRGLDNKGGTFENQVKIYQERKQAALISCHHCP